MKAFSKMYLICRNMMNSKNFILIQYSSSFPYCVCLSVSHSFPLNTPKRIKNIVQRQRFIRAVSNYHIFCSCFITCLFVCTMPISKQNSTHTQTPRKTTKKNNKHRNTTHKTFCHISHSHNTHSEHTKHVHLILILYSFFMFFLFFSLLICRKYTFFYIECIFLHPNVHTCVQISFND